LTSVLASEHLAVAALILAVLLGLGVFADDVSTGGGRGTGSSIARALATGLVLAAAVAVRSALASAPLAFVVAFWRGRPRGSRVALSLALVAGVVVGTAGYRAWLQTTYGAAPRNAVWWTLLTGTSAASGGSFSKADRDLFFARRTFDDANAAARAEVARRVRDQPVALAQLAWWKTVRLWLADDYAVGWATERMGPSSHPPPRAFLDALAQGFHVAALLLAFVGCTRLALRGTTSPGTGIDLVLLLLIFATLLHAAAESQARYHFPWQPWIFVLAAIGVVGPPGRHGSSNRPSR
jgi:ABC-type amino acid transport system permease subunit